MICILVLLFTTGFAVADPYSSLQDEAKELYLYDEPTPLAVASIEKSWGSSHQYYIVAGIGSGSGNVQELMEMDLAIEMPYPFNQDRTITLLTR